MLILSKILIAVSLAGLIRCHPGFRRMSREFDEQTFAVLKRAMRASEESGYPAQLIPLLIILTAISFMVSAWVTAVGVR